MQRRTFLKQCFAGAVALGTGAVGMSENSRKRPNFIFILTDDQRWDAMGFMGKFPWLKTPHIDRIRHEGIHFENAFVTHSLCSPSRASFHTGTYSHVHGVIQNESRDYDNQKTPSYSSLLGDHGYETAFIGKWHLAYGNQPRAGFKYWLAFDAQGVYEDCVLNENGREYTSQGYVTDVLNAKAVEFVEKQQPDSPFSLILSHKAVHAPFTPAPRHADQYADVEYPMPDTFAPDVQRKPQWLAHHAMKGIFRTKMPGRAVRLEQIEKKWEPMFQNEGTSYLDFYRGISAVDEGIGDIYNVLEKKGLLDNTVIVFAGDNGFFLGEQNGRLDKRLMYEESIRIPLVMRYPAKIKAGSATEAMVLNSDLAPTLLDLAGVKIPAVMQGHSWRPLFEGHPENWRHAVLYAYYMDLTTAIPDMVGVRTTDWKLIHYPDLSDIDELYDLNEDPLEKNNLALEPALERKRQELRALMEQLKDETGFNTSSYAAAPVTHQPRRPGSGLVLEYTFQDVKNNVIADVSGHDNHAMLLEGTIIETPDGKAIRCGGDCAASITFDRKTRFAGGPFAIDITFNARYDGIVAAWGDQTNGFAIFVEDGVPAFAFRSGKSLFIADGTQSCLGQWTRVTGGISNGRAHLYVNGRKVSQLAVGPFYWPREPEGLLYLGGVKETNVLFEIRSDGFAGEISRVRVFDDARTAEQIYQG